MIFKSTQPEISVPQDISLWDWLFESGLSPVSTTAFAEDLGFTDAITQQHLSYRHIKENATNLSMALKSFHGFSEGDVVTICAKNSIWYPVATLSVVRVGGVASGVSPEYKVDELENALAASRTKIVFSEKESLGKVQAAAIKCGISLENVILLEGRGQDVKSIQDLVKRVQVENLPVPPSFRLPNGKTNREVCAFLCFSSGTTGLPKAVMISHANIIAQCLQIQQITPLDHKKVLAALPFYHITGIVHQLHLPIFLNINVFVLSTFSLELFLKTVEQYKITELLIVPPILIQMVRNHAVVSKYDLSHVTRFSSGAAPLSRQILNQLEKLFPGTGFKQGYGMSESCSAITSHPPSKYAYTYADRVGQLVSSTEVRIVDPETGDDCGVGTPGEIWARGPQVAMGYLDNPEATASTFDNNGFLPTGDIGKFDEEGMLSITDRMKELIKVKGIGVAPAELENLLLGHPLVNDTAVCGIPDDRAGERPKAFVVLNRSAQLYPKVAAEELIEFVKSNKVRHKWIVEIEIVSRIPKSPAGKILRRVLLSNKVPGNLVVQDRQYKAKL